MANYLPVLLVSVSTNAIPDDSALVTLPRGQVDYLSHEWAEEDVWRSWRNMTRQKNEIANGVRLENASWRTWWKQRNKLKTVTPETLNWLKDSDVTWLYGPLHTAVDWTPPPKPKPDPTEVGKLSSAEDRLDLAAKHKPILKHRSITELLQSDLPTSPVFTPVDSEDEGEGGLENLIPVRPPLLHTKSAPSIPPAPHPSLRKPSPPRVPPPSMASSSRNGGPRRHITFNTFVEQCIAVDSPRRTPLSHNSSSSSNSNTAARAAWDGRTRGLRWTGDDDESDDNDSNNGGHWTGESALSSDSDDEDVLEVCLSRSRSSSHGSRSSRSSHNSTGRPVFANGFSKTTSKTIAPIAPARLKTTGVGNGWEGGEWVGTRDEGLPEELYLPRSGATTLPADGEEIFTHRSAYFSADGVYDYLGGPDLGVEFGPTIARDRDRGRDEPRGRRGSASAGAEILEIEIEGAVPSLLPARSRSRSKSRSKSRSRSRTPSPAILQPSSSSPSSSANTNGISVSVSPGGASPRSPNLLSPPPRGRDSSLSSSSSASQGRGRSATRTSSSSSLSDPSPPEYGGVRVSADYGSYPYTGYGVGGLVKGIRRGGNSSLSPDGGGSVSPEKGAPPSVGLGNGHLFGGRLDVEFGLERGDGDAPAGGDEEDGDDVYEGRGRGLQVRNPHTPVNSPVVRIAREPLFVSPANSTRSSSTASTTPPGSQSGATPTTSGTTLNKSNLSNTNPAAKSGSPKKPTSPTSKSIPISPPRSRPIKGVQQQQLVIEVEDGGPEEVDETVDEARRGAPTPANSPVVRVRVPPRIPDAAPAGAGAATKPAQSTAKSIPNAKPAAAGKPPPVSLVRATFQTSGASATPAAVASTANANSALQRTLVTPPAEGPGQGETPTIVGKAVGMVSTAGAYLGLWSGA
ncbi:DUF1752 domain-containing protein [Mycena venus]|uniref:DUF1752 domain-containing protein n=1 Tax=Mycena venus TaxID=2733690 RepID=A0A8H6YC85_9AGAR|nr:DUF1752 domain-containing protein [Mycena venus]